MHLKIGGDFFSNVNTAWLALSTIVLGVVLLLISFTSCCAVMNSGKKIKDSLVLTISHASRVVCLFI